jgi:hypothetical protein
MLSPKELDKLTIRREEVEVGLRAAYEKEIRSHWCPLQRLVHRIAARRISPHIFTRKVTAAYRKARDRYY